MIDTDDLERRLTDALDAAATTVPHTVAPSFSWQRGTDSRRDMRATFRRTALTGTGLMAAAAVAAVLVTTSTTGGTTSPGSNHSSAAGLASSSASGHPSTSTSAQPSSSVRGTAPTLLLAAAQTTLRTGDQVLLNGQYRYVSTTSVTTWSPASAMRQVAPSGSIAMPAGPTGPTYALDELWIPKDPNGIWLRRVTSSATALGDATWQGKCDDLYADTQDGPKGAPCTRPGSFDDPAPRFIAALPRQAGALYDQLRAWAQGQLNPQKDHDVNFVMFSTINQLLTDGVVTSDLASTLYTVLSRIPGITVVQGDKNYSGVAGTGFRLSTTFGTGAAAMPDTTTIIVDLQTGAYLGYSDVDPYVSYLDGVSTGVADTLGVAGS